MVTNYLEQEKKNIYLVTEHIIDRKSVYDIHSQSVLATEIDAFVYTDGVIRHYIGDENGLPTGSCLNNDGHFEYTFGGGDIMEASITIDKLPICHMIRVERYESGSSKWIKIDELFPMKFSEVDYLWEREEDNGEKTVQSTLTDISTNEFVTRMKNLKQKEETIMPNFDLLAQHIVRKYMNEHLDKSDGPVKYDIYTVWKCKILQNWKWLVSTSLPDGMYYEVTYNGDKGEFYLDAYKKFENQCIRLMDICGEGRNEI